MTAAPLTGGTDSREDDADSHRALVTDGFDLPPDLGGHSEAPPAYSEQYDQIQLEQSGFAAGAVVTGDGRVNININQTSRKFSDLLTPALQSQVYPPEKTAIQSLPPPYIPPSLGGRPGQTPPPKLNVVIQIVGSRGDVQPFVALGKVLQETYGHRVRLATHATFQKFVEENGLEFFSIGGDPAELMAFMVKNPGLMPGFDALKSGEVTKRRTGIEQIILGCWRSCFETGTGLGPPPKPHKRNEPLDERSFTLPTTTDDRPFVADVIIANPPSFAHIHIAEKLGIPLHMMFTMPWSPTRAFPHPLANIQSTNTDVVMTNFVSYAMVEMMTWQGLGDVINRFRTNVLDLEPMSLIWAPGILSRLHVPTTYCWSPALIPKPNDWSREISIAGFYFLNLASNYTPEPDLAAFLAAGPPPVYIGFGSIVVEDPNKLTRMIFDAIQATGVRALVSKGWGGIGADSVGIPDGVFMLGNCPHDWLFQHVSAVVHHGGAGTSAAGIKLGKPTVVVPFFGDQPFWGAMIARAGAGPNPIPYAELTAEKLAGAIQECLKPEIQAKAQELGEKIREEKGTDVGGKSFHEFLDLEAMRCSIAPSRVAVWRVRRTQIRLSALAAAVLVKEKLIKYTDLKPYRSKEHNTDEQPWDPISAVTAALIGDVGSISMAIADFPREMFKRSVAMKDECKSKGSSSSTAREPASAVTSETASVDNAAMSGALPRSDSVSVSDGASLSTHQSHPSLTISAPEHVSVSEPASASAAASSENLTTTTSADRPLTPSSLKGKLPSRSTSPNPGPSGLNLENALDASKGVGRIVTTGVRSPLNFCMGLARGFRNAPKLYNDDTVRPPEKVTDLASGLKLAGKEFGLGLYDGISGLVTQPIRGAEKEGAAGLIKGFGKGIGGLVFKPAAGFWSLPAYAMKGVDAQIRSFFSKSVLNYIITSRALQGMEELQSATEEEQQDIVARWGVRRKELKGFYHLKQKEKGKGKAKENDQGDDSSVTPPATPFSPDDAGTATSPQGRTSWFHTRNMSFDERRIGHSMREAWRARRSGTSSPTRSHHRTGSFYTADEHDEFEKAIRDSVRQTSRGNPEEDARVEEAIRASVLQMQRIAETSTIGSSRPSTRDDFTLYSAPSTATSVSELPTHAQVVAELPTPEQLKRGPEPVTGDITDEEYQALIEEAVRRSVMENTAQGRGRDDDDGADNEQLRRAMEESGRHQATRGHEDDEALRRAIAESQKHHQQASAAGAEADEELKRALAESEKVHKERERERTEEEIVLEYIKKQSLAEEEHRQRLEKAKGKMASKSGDGDDGEEEELRRAMEESLKTKLGGGGGGGGSGGEGSGGGAGGSGGGSSMFHPAGRAELP